MPDLLCLRARQATLGMVRHLALMSVTQNALHSLARLQITAPVHGDGLQEYKLQSQCVAMDRMHVTAALAMASKRLHARCAH